MEMIYQYAQVYELAVTEEVVYAMAQVCEGNLFYVSALFQSYAPEKDFTTEDGMLKTLEYETLNEHGTIRGVWMEYLSKIFYKVNQEHAKRIVLYLCQHRNREVGRDELRAQLGLTMTEFELEQKLHVWSKRILLNKAPRILTIRGVRIISLIKCSEGCTRRIFTLLILQKSRMNIMRCT
ncbi:MAG: hypothetical protein RBT80_00010 [Candidatus Vecturithrix sp.]|nr:hypothetical protein [Candidatus Vecturithrix sp.]